MSKYPKWSTRLPLLFLLFIAGSHHPSANDYVVMNGRIAFVSDRDGNHEIYTMNPDGGSAERLTHDPGVDTMPNWTPSGTQLVFVSDRTGDYDIYVVNIDGTNLQNLTNSPENEFDPDWSPTGEHLAFSRENFLGSDIYVLDVSASTTVNLTNQRNNSYNLSPTWSPDGQQIAFASDRNHRPQSGISQAFDLFLMRSDGSDQSILVGGGPNTGSPDWSPDSLSLAFHDPFLSLEIAVVEIGAPNTQWITENNHADLNPVWSPDGEFIAFASRLPADYDTEIAILRFQDNTTVYLTDNSAYDDHPAWQPIH